MKCDYCNQKGIYYHCNHKTGKLENLCKYHYSKWHEDFVIEDIKKMQQCYVCKDTAKILEHHVSYFPQIIIKICKHCHNEIHKSKKYEGLLPPIEDQQIFWARKGWITKKSHPFHIRKLTDEEKQLRKQSLRGDKKCLVN